MWACVTLIALFGLSACGGGGNNALTNSTTTDTGNTNKDSTTPLSAPTQVALTLKNHNQIDVTWDAVANAESYKVYTSPKSITTLATPDFANYNTLESSKIIPVAKGKTTHSLTGLDYGTTYYVIVQSVGNGSSTTSNAYAQGQEKSVKTGEAGPKNLAVVQQDKKLKYTWDKVDNASQYNLYLSNLDLSGKTLDDLKKLLAPDRKAFKVVVTKDSGTSYTTQDIDVGTKYYATITAVVNDKESAPSAVVNKTIARFEKLANYEGKCVIDHKSNLIWEVKQASGLHGKDHTYSWYQTEKNGGYAGTKNGGECYNKASGNQCDTTGFVNSVKTEKWCGFADWRMPTKDELLSLVDKSKGSPTIDTAFFPNTHNESYWSSSPNASSSSSAWGVGFSHGGDSNANKGNSYRARLVRSR